VTSPPVLRFAPSPTGRLHVGNIRTALLNWLFARQQRGRFLLRLDDTDTARSSEAAAAAIRRDLAWLGLVPDAEVRQSDRFALYDAALARLAASGHAYPAYETAEELDLKRRLQRAAGKPPVYDREALALSEANRAALETKGRRPHWRFRLDTDEHVRWNDLIRGETALDPASLSDPIVRREDGSWLYMLPSVVDDIEMGITHVVRGEDHVPNSAIQLQMFTALGAPAPAMAHAALLTSVGGELSKRIGSEGADALEAAGLEPIAVLAYLARLGSSDPIEPVASIEPLIESFAFAKLGRAAARYDPAELAHLNERIVHGLDYAIVRDRLPAGIDAEAWSGLRTNLKTVGEAAEWADVLNGTVAAPAQPDEAEFLKTATDALPPAPLGPTSWKAWTDALKATTGRKGRALYHPLRVALTGRETGPEMATLLPLIGRERASARLAAQDD